jgi:hypothetical protein
MKVFKTWSNSKPTEGKKFTQPSMTTPDQTMSMRTILERYAKGLPVSDGKEAIWDDDAENSSGINPKTLDLVDLQIIAMDNKEKISQLEKVKKEDEINVNNKKAEAKAKAKQELIDELKKATKETHSTNIP